MTPGVFETVRLYHRDRTTAAHSLWKAAHERWLAALTTRQWARLTALNVLARYADTPRVSKSRKLATLATHAAHLSSPGGDEAPTELDPETHTECTP